MLLSVRPPSEMGAPPLPAPQLQSRHFKQCSRTAILTLPYVADAEDEVANEVGCYFRVDLLPIFFLLSEGNLLKAPGLRG